MFSNFEFFENFIAYKHQQTADAQTNKYYSNLYLSYLLIKI